MTIYIQNTSVTNTFDFWRNRTNQIAYALSNSVVTVNSNTAIGDAAITGLFTANTLLLGNSTVNASLTPAQLYLGNSTVNTTITTVSMAMTNTTSNLTISLPTSVQYSNGQYYLNANGSWSVIAPPETATQTLTTSGTSTQNLDGFSISTYNVAEYILSVKDNNANNYFTGKFILAHDSGTAYITQFATFTSNTNVGTFTAAIAAGNAYLKFAPVSTSTTVKFFRLIV